MMNQGFSFETEPEQAAEVTQTRRQTMTAEAAQTFERFSATNAATVATVFACGCEAYADVFTYRRWQAQGFQVRRGEKALKLPGYFTKTQTDAATGSETTVRIPRTNAVFCRHQVDAKGASAPRLDDQTPATDN